MTNEQLRVLLAWIGEALRAEIFHLKKQLANIEGIERNPNFYKDDEYHGRVADVAPFAWEDKDLEEFAEREGFEIRYDGEPVILKGLYAIINRIAEHNRILAR